MMRFLATCLLLVCVTGALGISRPRVARMFESFKAKHNKVYATEEEHALRMRVFNLNVRFIEQHNKEYDQGLHTYTLGVNQFADLTNDEFVNLHLSSTGVEDMSDVEVFDRSSVEDVPETVDWREKGYVTPPKNQGQCGSCWSFSAIGAIEGAHFKATGELVSLSEQDLLDCDKQSQGCKGGWMRTAFQEAIKDGVNSEADYPYEGKNGECRVANHPIAANITSYKTNPKGDENALKAASAEVGPISVAIDASPMGFQFYLKGVYSSFFCSSTKLNHGVLLVGYGAQKTLLHGERDYWLIKNSWGKAWGDDGYIKIHRNHKNMCGVATQSSYPVV